MVKLLVDVRDADLKAKLQAALLEAQGEALALQEQVAQLRDQNAELRKLLEEADRAATLEDDLYFARNALWRKSETALSAYCTTCWGTEKQLIRLKLMYDEDGAYCPNCKGNDEHVYQFNKRPEPE